jgi:tRNA(His) 5'-end guanylyltransferase
MANNKDSLGDRMKEYEYVTRNYLTRKLPVIIRIDGKAFHSFTRGFKKPFDEIFVKSMQETTKYLCENVQGCVLGYCQSDEITLVLVDYQNREASAWFDNNIQKMVSVSASMATMAFNRFFINNCHQWYEDNIDFDEIILSTDVGIKTLFNAYTTACKKGAMFDSRVFTLPKEEVINCLIWRQQDATRNSIQSVGQANFSHTQLHGKNCSDIQDMLMLEKGINWNDYPTHLKRGSCCIKKPFKINEGTEQEAIRNKWVIDTEIPIFTQDKDYVNKLIFI